MAITNGYATLAALKSRLGLTDTVDDANLEAAIEAASRAIEGTTGRVFYATTATRHFSADSSGVCYVDDLLSLTTLKTDDDGDRTYENTWAATDYDLAPYNTAPKWRIEARPSGSYAFPTGPRGVEVTGSWGYSATTPAAVTEACLIQAIRLFKRKDSPFGVLGTPEMGVARIPKVDADVHQLLQPFRKMALRR